MKLFGSSSLIGLSLAAANLATANDQLSLADPLDPEHQQLECTHPPYTVHFLSRDPVLMYIANFLTPFERRHLLETRYGFVCQQLSTSKPDSFVQCIIIHQLPNSRSGRHRDSPEHTALQVRHRHPRRRDKMHRRARLALPRFRHPAVTPRTAATCPLPCQ